LRFGQLDTEVHAMRKPISTKAHGVLDFMTAGLLVTLPRAMGWSNCVTRLLDASAATTVVYSLLTRYEFGVVKALPFKAHLVIDALQGGALIGASAFLEDEDPEVRATLAALGAFELGVTALSRTEPDAAASVEREFDASSVSMPQAGYPEVGVPAEQPQNERRFVAM
jgi:hypothetical protein